ncbi:cell division protein FtsZ [[Acholeplasma] multilocale]|uniref:cell division protein FtsZ n=1 Tax=[Acholeplasma] multilocale TaxID=264638 RepID=UPI00040F26A2|nr:cell division protein FtsZ [[Acholeplasma] multilocale]
MENNNTQQEFTQKAKIKVIGVGGGGNNAVNRMVNEGVQGVDFIIANTDAQVLAASKVPTKIILGEQISKGLGAGANPEVGKQAALESEHQLREALSGADLIFVAAGMGGGTGTGAAPVIAKIAQESGALVVAIVTKPFRFEGKHRNRFAGEGLTELKKYVDSIIVISNDKLLEYIGGMPIQDSFKEADAILKQGVQTITDLIAVPAVINLDFADVRTVMFKKGNALFGIGIASGEEKAVNAANKAISSSLLEASISGAKDVIVNITGGKNISLNDAYDAVDVVEQAANNDDLNIVFGIAINEQLESEDELIVTVIATGFEEREHVEVRQQPSYRSTNLADPFEINSKKEVKSEVEEEYISQDKNVQREDILAEDIFDNDDFPTFLK